MEGVKNGLSEKNTVSDRTDVKPVKKSNQSCSSDKKDIKLVNCKTYGDNMDKDIEHGNFVNGSDSNEADDVKENIDCDTHETKQTEEDGIEMIEKNSTTKSAEENSECNKQNGFENTYGNAEDQVVCSENGTLGPGDQTEQHTDIANGDSEEDSKSNEVNVSAEKNYIPTGDDLNVSDCALSNIPSKNDDLEDRQNEHSESPHKKEDCDEVEQGKSEDDSGVQGDIIETDHRKDQVESNDKKNDEMESGNKVSQTGSRDIEQNETEHGNKEKDQSLGGDQSDKKTELDVEKLDKGEVTDVESVKPKQSPEKSDDVIVLDDGEDDEKEESKSKKEEKSGTNEKSPIILNCYTMNKSSNEQRPAKGSDDSGLKTPDMPKVTPSKDNQKPHPVPEFAKDLRPMAMNLCTIGMNLVREHVYNDLIKIQSKKLVQNKLNDMAQKQLDIIKTAAKSLEKENELFKMELKECVRTQGPACGFQTESESVMELHKHFPHGNIGNFYCSYCEFLSARKQDLIFHMEAMHSKQARFIPSFSYLVCCFCKYESDSPKGFNKHVIKCAKTFNLKRNLEPSPADCDIPLKNPKPAKPALTKSARQAVAPKPLPGTNLQVSKPKAAVEVVTRGSKQSITIHPPKVPPPLPVVNSNTAVIRQPAPIVTQQQNKINLSGLRPVTNMSYPYTQYLIGNTYYTVVNHNGQLMLQPSTMVAQNTAGIRPGTVPPAVLTTGPRSQVSQLLKLPPGPPANSTMAKQTAVQAVPDKKQKITPPRDQGKMSVRAILEDKKTKPEAPKAAPALPAGVKPSGFKVCEICGGFVKDTQSLRIHFYWKHNIDIPKEVDEPSFSCFLCVDPKAFWTINGLELHQAQEHGMGSKSVSKPKQTPGKKKDGTAKKPIVLSPEKSQKTPSNGIEHGCYLCGVRTNGILQHLLETHRISVNTMSKMKKCLVCGLELGSLINLHTHLQVKHGLNTQANSPTGIKKVLVPEIKQTSVCQICKLNFSSPDLYSKHFEANHNHKCYRCDKTWSTKEALLKHYAMSHKMDKDECQLCGASVMIGSSFIRHVKRQHLKTFNVSLERLCDDQLKKWVKNPIASVFTSPCKKQEKTTSKISLKRSSKDDDAEKSPLNKTQVENASDRVPSKKSKKEENDAENCVQEVIEVDGEKIILEVYSSDEEKEES